MLFDPKSWVLIVIEREAITLSFKASPAFLTQAFNPAWDVTTIEFVTLATKDVSEAYSDEVADFVAFALLLKFTLNARPLALDPSGT